MDLFFHYLTMPYLLQGIGFTIEATVLGLAGGLLIGLVLAGMQLSRFWLPSALARAYTVIFRGTPLILQLVFAYDALPRIGLKLDPIAAAGLALSFNEAPFIAEIIRSGVLGVEPGQRLAGQALGMTPLVLMRHIIAPQAIRIMVPALGNETISTLKNSSLASVISVQELTLRSTQLASSTFDFFSIFFASGLLYLGLTGAVAGIQLIAESLLDLDRPRFDGRTAPSWFARLLPWRRPSAPATAEAPATMQAETPPSQPAPTQPMMPRKPRSGHGQPMIEVEALGKRYGEHVVLKDVGLTVRSGEIVALLGPSGSGKSTLLRCINHLEQWDTGIIRVGGRRLGFGAAGQRLSPRMLARERAELGVGMVFQQFNLFSHLTARQNIAGPLRWVHGTLHSAASLRAAELLQRVGLTHRADALPRHMSGGQQQRVAIARALAPSPSVLLLDEPTSALDPELVNEVLEVIRRLADEDGLTMIISTHQVRFAYEIADRVVFLADGMILEDGPAQEVLSHPRHPATQRFLRAMGAPHLLEQTET